MFSKKSSPSAAPVDTKVSAETSLFLLNEYAFALNKLLFDPEYKNTNDRRLAKEKIELTLDTINTIKAGGDEWSSLKLSTVLSGMVIAFNTFKFSNGREPKEFDAISDHINFLKNPKPDSPTTKPTPQA